MGTTILDEYKHKLVEDYIIEHSPNYKDIDYRNKYVYCYDTDRKYLVVNTWGKLEDDVIDISTEIEEIVTFIFI